MSAFPDKLGGDASRSEAGAVCPKFARSALLISIRAAHRLEKERSAEIHKERAVREL